MIVLLPLGAVEAHGPHLPLDTDTRIALHLAARCADALRLAGRKEVRIAAPITSTAAAFAANFPGTVHSDPAVETRIIVDAVRTFQREGATQVVLVNLHFDPEHMRAVKDALHELGSGVVFPNFTRRLHAQAIGGEFATGACHGGEFETSLLLVAAPGTVLSLHRDLPDVQVDLARAIKEGKRSFAEVGMDRAYCGHPSTASLTEGERLYGILTAIVLREIG